MNADSVTPASAAPCSHIRLTSGSMRTSTRSNVVAIARLLAKPGSLPTPNRSARVQIYCTAKHRTCPSFPGMIDYFTRDGLLLMEEGDEGEGLASLDDGRKSQRRQG